MIWPWKQPRHPQARAYKQCQRKAPGRRDIAENIRFIVLDAETSGFDRAKDRMLSLATMRIEDLELHLSDMNSWLIYQADAGLTEAVNVHGILPSETADGESEQAVMAALLPILGNAPVVGHHIGFDADMIDQAFRRHFGIRFRNCLVDTAELAMRELDAFARTGYANQRPPTLEDLCSHLEISMVDRHTAAGDTFTTAQVFLTLCARIQKRLKRDLQLRDLS
ncbi:MAG: 3'-5' exonuclease [Opitutales bacterium]|nr:3'-5' exonuclease [Opitutales bacterium]